MSDLDVDATDQETPPPSPSPTPPDPFEGVPEVFAKALVAQGFTELTAVQEAVLSPELQDRDLRISSQTGSGKTVALGLVVADDVQSGPRPPVDAEAASAVPRKRRPARPAVLVVAPTRELAAQLGRELAWLYGALHVRIAVVTGGTAIGGDYRDLSTNPAVLVGTPGRLVDHLERQTLALDGVRTVVLDEADEMLDMGFREELDRILETTPKERRTHLVSATFTARVRKLADRFQSNPAMVQGTVGKVHADIDHSVVMLPPDQRIDVLINLLLLHPEERALVFVRTRVDATGIAGELSALGFSVNALSGDLAQRERTRCLAEFRSHKLQCVVATDVAARGLDIRGVQLIVHFDPPSNVEALTHRSGRTGRAGDKGRSLVLATGRNRYRVERVFRDAGIRPNWVSAPSPEEIQKAADERLLRAYRAAPDASPRPAPNPHLLELAEELLAHREAPALVAELLERADSHGPTQPRRIRPVESRVKQRPQQATKAGPGRTQSGPGGGPRRGRQGFVPFHITWGGRLGANPKRLLAHVCRRGHITGGQVGAIQIDNNFSIVDVDATVAEDFAAAVAAKDPRNPKVKIRRYEERRAAKKG